MVAEFVGTHRVQRIPTNDTRRHTSTATVALVPDVAPVQVRVSAKDLEITRYRASGAGGQHRNKKATAVRIRHRPSGVVVSCADERDLETNRRRAIAELERRLSAQATTTRAADANATRLTQVRADRAAKAFTHNHQRDEVSCHETGRTWRARDWHRGLWV